MNPTAKPSFRIRSNGYDRGEVDDFVRGCQQESVRLQLRVAQLDATLEAILEYLQSRRRPEGVSDAHAIRTAASPAIVDWNALALEWSNRRLLPIAAAVVAVALVSGALFWTGWHIGGAWFRRPAVTNTTVTGQSKNAPPASAPSSGIPATVATPETRLGSIAVTPARAAVRSVTASAAGVTVELEALTSCWVGATLDGDRRVERLLERGEHLSMSASDVAVLRVGSAGAVSLRINGLPGKSLGPLGRPVTIRVTPATYRQLLEPPTGIIASN